MLKPDRIEIIERHPEAEQPYNLIKEIFVNRIMVNGVETVTEKSSLVAKNIREEGHVAGIQLTKKELEAKKIKELGEEQEHSAKLLKDAEESGNSDVGKKKRKAKKAVKEPKD